MDATDARAPLDDLDAGPVGPWLEAIDAALRGEAATDVPCGTCTACCTSSQFVHVEPDEHEALAAIPPALLVAAPGRPPGHVVLGFDEQGHCPMLGDDGCSIYEHRPRTCRIFDCRVFAAAAVLPDPVRQPRLAAQAARWRFTPTDAADQAHLDAVHAAARHLSVHPELIVPSGAPPAVLVALLALGLRATFLERQPTDDEVAARLAELEA